MSPFIGICNFFLLGINLVVELLGHRVGMLTISDCFVFQSGHTILYS